MYVRWLASFGVDPVNKTKVYDVTWTQDVDTESQNIIDNATRCMGDGSSYTQLHTQYASIQQLAFVKFF